MERLTPIRVPTTREAMAPLERTVGFEATRPRRLRRHYWWKITGRQEGGGGRRDSWKRSEKIVLTARARDVVRQGLDKWKSAS